MAIEDWMPTLGMLLGEVTGIKQAHIYDELPGSLLAFPALVIMPVSGTQQLAPGIALHTVQVNLYVAGSVLPEAHGMAVPFIKLIRDKVAANVTLGGLVQYCQPVVPPEKWYEGPGKLDYGDKTHVGIIFRLTVKESEAITIGG